MKSIIVIRHAKSSWNDPYQQDFDRPLNKRGHKDAPEMAQRLLNKQITVDAFVASPAIRAFTTCTYFVQAYKRNVKEIIVKPELYHAPAETFYSVIQSLSDVFHSIAIFSHNPGITAFVNELSTVRIDDMPTCGMYGITSAIKNWKDFTVDAENTFAFFDYPKMG